MTNLDVDLFDALTLVLGRQRVAELAVGALTSDELRAALRQHAVLIHPDRVAAYGEAPARTRRLQQLTVAYERIRQALSSEPEGGEPLRANGSSELRPNGPSRKGAPIEPPSSPPTPPSAVVPLAESLRRAGQVEPKPETLFDELK